MRNPTGSSLKLLPRAFRPLAAVVSTKSDGRLDHMSANGGDAVRIEALFYRLRAAALCAASRASAPRNGTARAGAPLRRMDHGRRSRNGASVRSRAAWAAQG